MNNSDEQENIAEINKLHQELQELATDALDRAIRLGELLSTAKSHVPHGQWLAWLTRNVTFSERTARNYMRVFENRATLKSANVADLAEAYHLLARRNTGPMTKEEAERVHKEIIRMVDVMADLILKQLELQREYPELKNVFPEIAAMFKLLTKSRTDNEFRHHLFCQILIAAGLADEADRLSVPLD